MGEEGGGAPVVKTAKQLEKEAKKAAEKAAKLEKFKAKAKTKDAAVAGEPKAAKKVSSYLYILFVIRMIIGQQYSSTIVVCSIHDVTLMNQDFFSDSKSINENKTRMSTFINAKPKKSDEHKQIQSSCKCDRKLYYKKKFLRIIIPKFMIKRHLFHVKKVCKNFKN